MSFDLSVRVPSEKQVLFADASLDASKVAIVFVFHNIYQQQRRRDGAQFQRLEGEVSHQVGA